jgi:hypothetical protein
MHGELSPETVPLCRRCHRTYHDRGLEWFDDDILDKAIELENRRREIINEIINSKRLTPPYPGISVPYNLRHLSPPLPMVDKAEVVASRSDYWYKKHGLTKPRTPVNKAQSSIVKGVSWELQYRGTEPLCGKEWLDNALARVDTKLFNQSMTIVYDGKVLGEFDASTKRGEVKRLMKGTADKKVLTG